VNEIVALAEAVVRQRGRAPIERRLEAGIGRVFRSQARAFPATRVTADLLARRQSLREALDPRLEAEVLAAVEAAWPSGEDRLADAISRSGAQASRLATNWTLASIGMPNATSIAPALVDWLAEHSLTRAREIDATSMERIRDVLARGIEQDHTTARIARDLRGEFDGWTRPSARGRLTAEERAIVRRAEMIAVTEVAEAWEETSYRVLQEQEFEYVIWIDSQDERTCEICIGNAAAGPVRVGEPFPSGDLHPPAHPLDRCATGAYVE
jgi:hypothetical protein